MEQAESETDKIRVLKSMGNMGSKELTGAIKNIIDDKSQPLVVRTQAVFALRKIAKPFDKLVCVINTHCSLDETIFVTLLLSAVIEECTYRPTLR